MLTYQQSLEKLAALKADPFCENIGTAIWVNRLYMHRNFGWGRNIEELEKLELAQREFAQASQSIVSNIQHYTKDGFQKICNVENIQSLAWQPELKWLYTDINTELMYAKHKSWVYFIVSGETIQKVGETGNPLGIRAQNSNQPRWATTCRLGRLASHKCNTDGRIRNELKTDTAENKVSIWAKKCEIFSHEISVGGEKINTQMTFHKEVELQYIDYMSRNYFSPKLNQCRK